MYEYESRIGFSRCDVYKRLTLAGLIDMFQDCSTFQSEDIGFGFDVLEKQNLAWVINYWELDVEELPHLCDRVIVGTFPYDINTFFAYRNFYMKDDEGRFIVKANTFWTLLDMKKCIPARIGNDLRYAYELETKLDMNYSSRKVEIPTGEDVKTVIGDRIIISGTYLDSNNHVNNGSYVKIALEAAQKEALPETIKSLRIDYRKQAVLGDIIVPVVYISGYRTVVSLTDGADIIYSVMEIKASNKE